MNILEQIQQPEDLKKLNLQQLKILSKEIRHFLIHSLSKTGGHLASNLGVVELTMALHYCFDSPKDKMIWDVGHQSYVHKILTGRQEQFPTLRKYEGMSGFPKCSESPHDVFDTGHSATSISAALGYALSRDLKNEDNYVLGIIGDGSITGGLAYEALNNAGRSNTNMIVILNDNEMSISKNVGGITKHLNDIRSAPNYISVKADVNKFLQKVPVVGDKVGKLMEGTKNGLKYLLVKGIVFEELGFKYIGPVDGHNLEELIRVFQHMKKINGPILLHVYTKKGKGYSYAQKSPENYHGVSAFDISTGKPLKPKGEDTYSDVFGKKLLQLAGENEKIVAVTAAMCDGTGLGAFQQKYPKRLFDVGIAEAHAVTFAAGMAKNGLLPVVCVYSTFLQRAYDQILHDVCNQNLPVIFAIDRGGIVGEDGETHQGIFDLSYLSHIPNMTILAPKNKKELEMMLAYAVALKRPVAIRYPKGVPSKLYEDQERPIVYGKSELLEQGKDLCIVSVGAMIDTAKEVWDSLMALGYTPALVNARFVKPLEDEWIRSLQAYQHVFILEDNVKAGGFYSQVLIRANELGVQSSIHSFTFPDAFIPHGSKEQLFARYGLDAKHMTDKILNCIKSKD